MKIEEYRDLVSHAFALIREFSSRHEGDSVCGWLNRAEPVRMNLAFAECKRLAERDVLRGKSAVKQLGDAIEEALSMVNVPVATAMGNLLEGGK